MKETNVLKLCLMALSEAGCMAFRNNVGALADKTGRLIRYGVGGKGGADLIGIAPDGIFFAVEVKTATGKPTPEQLTFIAAIRRQGGRAGVARSPAEAVSLALGQKDSA
jgi:hypothetical protein